MKRSSGFTLIELTVVLLVMAITAGVVTLNMAGPLSKVHFEDVMATLENSDSFCRNYARNTDRVVLLKIDVDAGVIEKLDAEKKLLGRRVEIGSHFKIKRVMVAGGEAEESGRIVTFSRRGLSRSYAIFLEDKKKGVEKFVFFSGLTGQMLEFEDESSVEKIFNAIQKSTDAG